MFGRTQFTRGICLSILLSVTTTAAMTLATKDAKNSDAINASGKDAKEAVAQMKTPVLVRQMDQRILFTAPQPAKKMCAENEDYPSPEQLNDPDIRRWYEIDDGEHDAPQNEVLRNLVAVVKEHFIHKVFPYYKNILIAFDIDETALTYFEYYYKFYKMPPLNQLEVILNATRDCGANQPILDLYNFFKTNGCTVVFISSRSPSVDVQDLYLTIHLEHLTWKGLKAAGYDVEETKIHLCSDHTKKQQVRQGIARWTYSLGGRFDYIAAVDDDIYVLCAGDDLDCCIWVPSAYRVDREAEMYYKTLEDMPNPEAANETTEDELLAPSFQLLHTTPDIGGTANDVCITIKDQPLDDVKIDVSVRCAEEVTSESMQHAKAKDNATCAASGALLPATISLCDLLNTTQPTPLNQTHNPQQ